MSQDHSDLQAARRRPYGGPGGASSVRTFGGLAELAPGGGLDYFHGTLLRHHETRPAAQAERFRDQLLMATTCPAEAVPSSLSPSPVPLPLTPPLVAAVEIVAMT